MPHHVSKDEFAALVQQALDLLPEPFKSQLEQLRIEIRPRPSKKLLKELGMDSDELLLGLFEGQPLTERSVSDDPDVALHEVIYIFQEDCELVSDSAEQLVEEVRITVLHEIGHHMGMSEEDLDALGYG